MEGDDGGTGVGDDDGWGKGRGAGAGRAAAGGEEGREEVGLGGGGAGVEGRCCCVNLGVCCSLGEGNTWWTELGEKVEVCGRSVARYVWGTDEQRRVLSKKEKGDENNEISQS